MAHARCQLARVSIDNTEFCAPVKQIHDGSDLNHFLVSEAYRDLTLWLQQLNRCMFPIADAKGHVQVHNLDAPINLSANVQEIAHLIEDLLRLIEQAPPDTGPRRFGNIAFRRWFALAESQVESLLLLHLKVLKPGTALVQELRIYLLDSFGSPQRLDYGTGHELSFLAFLGCLWKVGLFEDGEEQAIVVALFQPYLELIRKLILTYTLEPAGSHGVWGLDDHSFVPYIVGSAQLGPAISQDHKSTAVPTEGSLPDSPSPSSVTDLAVVSRLKDSNLYFSAIQFIYDVKKGPFWEHSPILYDVAGIKDGWAKINKGMLKMYAAEVLAKFPVVQHFKFGSMFRWTRDSGAVSSLPTVHAQQQAAVTANAKVLPPTAVGTTAPWAKPQVGGSGRPPTMTGVPSTRAPWASTTKQGRTARDRPSE